MKNWDEIRTAYAVAKFGTVTVAAELLGIQWATVIRHIDQLASHPRRPAPQRKSATIFTLIGRA